MFLRYYKLLIFNFILNCIFIVVMFNYKDDKKIPILQQCVSYYSVIRWYKLIVVILYQC